MLKACWGVDGGAGGSRTVARMYLDVCRALTGDVHVVRCVGAMIGMGLAAKFGK